LRQALIVDARYFLLRRAHQLHGKNENAFHRWYAASRELAVYRSRHYRCL
jgi:hypothetical protein